MGNGEAKELTCMTHGHELRGDSWGRGLGEGYQAKGENWDNCPQNWDSIINKIYFFQRAGQNKLWLSLSDRVPQRTICKGDKKAAMMTMMTPGLVVTGLKTKDII